ncbi:hypothetical protein H4582DRAFT_1066065 [Lactarius indigo]|nr:hypothetical protein H4582DRAFT_1066065 [Lactarius indigo]
MAQVCTRYHLVVKAIGSFAQQATCFMASLARGERPRATVANAFTKLGATTTLEADHSATKRYATVYLKWRSCAIFTVASKASKLQHNYFFHPPLLLTRFLNFTTMSHGYSLRPNAKGRMEKRLNAYVAAFGEENKNNIVAAPSETGEGIRLVFDRERSLEPVPGGPIEQGYTDTSEDVIIIDDSDSDTGADCDSDSGFESDASSASPQTPPRVHFEPTSALRTPRPQRHGEQRQEDWREGSVASTVSVADSMASIVERGRVLRSQLQDVQAGRKRVEEQRRAEGQRIRVEQIHRLFEEQEKILRERLTALQQEYEQVIAQLDQEDSEGFSIKEESESESNWEYTPTETSESGRQQQRLRSPMPWAYPGRENRQKSLTPWAEPGNVPPNVRFASPSLSPSSSPVPVAGPSRMGPSMMEQHQQEQSSRGLRRQHAQHMFVSPRKYSNTGGEFVTVTQRIQKLGPSGTAVFDAYTNEPVVETKRYRVRADILQGIDEDSDMEDL